MNKLYRLIGLFLVLLSLAACQKPDAIDSLDKPIRLTDYHDKWMVINYWATWCKPCLTEMPELNQLYAQHQDKLVVLGINFDGISNADIQRFSQSKHLSFPLLSKFPIDKFGINEIPTIPVTFIINPQGKLYKTLYGPQTQQTLLQATLETTAHEQQ